MKHSNYQLPNFINVIYKKVESTLRAGNVDLTRFNQFCLAVQLFHLKRYRESIVGLRFSEKDESALNDLCDVCHFHPGKEDEGTEGEILTGLSPELFGDFGPITKIQLLVNYFCRYEVLKNNYDKSLVLENDYNAICTNLETLRHGFRLPARFKYNKSMRRDNPFFKGGVEVTIPERTLPEPKDTVTPESFAVSPENAAE
jgi:hypothetical protein